MGTEQTSCFTNNIGEYQNEILKFNYHKRIVTKPKNSPNKTRQKNINKNINIKNYKSVEQMNSSSRTNTRSNSSSQNNQNKIIIIQKNIRLFLSKKKLKERIELLMNIIELDNTVNLIKDKTTSLKILSENKGELLWKELITKKKIIPYEDTPYYRKNIKNYRPNKYLVSTQLIYIDKYKNNNLYKGTWTLEKVFHGFGTFYISGNKYEGFWNFGKLEGECRYYLQNNEYFLGNFVNGQAQGKGKYYHKMINHQEQEKKYLLMVLYLKDYLKMDIKRKVNLNGMMEVIMMEILIIIHLKDLEYFIGKKEENIKDLGKKEKCVDMV